MSPYRVSAAPKFQQKRTNFMPFTTKFFLRLLIFCVSFCVSTAILFPLYKVITTPPIGNFCYIDTRHYHVGFQRTILYQNIDWGIDRELYSGDITGAIETAARLKCEIK